MDIRASKHDTFLRMAVILSEQSTCVRRKVGAILIDKHHHIVGSGYNGVAAGMRHCIEKPCFGAMSPSGTNLDACEAIHAEQNALMQCHDVHKIVNAYVTTMPCMHCIKMLLNTSCTTIYYRESYAHHEAVKALWLSAGRRLEQI